MGTDDHLHGKTKINQIAAGAHIDIFQMMQQRGAIVPGHVFALVDHVVAIERRNRNEGQVMRSRVCWQIRYTRCTMRLKDFLVVIHQIHLVDGNQDMRNLQQRGE